MDDPESFGRLVSIVAETDLGRTELAMSAVDALCPDTPWDGIEWMVECWKECGRSK